MTDHLDQEHDMTSPTQRRHDVDQPYTVDQTQPDDRTRTEKSLDLIADHLRDVILELRVGNSHDLLTEIRDALTPTDRGDWLDEPAPVPRPEPVDVTEEPPVGSQLTDADGDIWQRLNGADRGWGQRTHRLAVIPESEGGCTWSDVRTWSPLRPTTDADRVRVGLAVEPAPADDGLAEWERELLRPATCCGKCPPIAGGGYDCTCEGNPRCEKADTPEEWHAEPAPADEDPDEALAKVIYAAYTGYDTPEVPSGWLDVARAAREHIEAEADDADFSAASLYYARAEKAEAERDALRDERDSLRHVLGEERKIARAVESARDEWKDRHAALRADVKWLVKYVKGHPFASSRAERVAHRIEWDALNSDDKWGDHDAR